ncbi:hypothetical protein [Sorangium cellulosum]|uniref:hypothetical protein n=1 Tax=Sorangium cellulosum TaxID=56 RepID=UPI0012DB6141|nr:hypothetical protein [Sorangium cellulosum]
MTNTSITNGAPKDLDIAMKEIRNAVDDLSGRSDSAETMELTSAHCGCGHCGCGHCGCGHCGCGHCGCGHCHCART